MTQKAKNHLIVLVLVITAMLGLMGCSSQAPLEKEKLAIPIEKSTPPSASSALIKTRAGDLTLSYANGQATLAGILQRSTPCVDWKIKSKVMERFPEQVIFEVQDISTAQMCIQMLGEPQDVKESVNVSGQASFRVLFGGEGIFSGQLGDSPISSKENPSEKKSFCCGSFDERTAETTYFWSDDSRCGYPEDVACAGSCPSPVENVLCGKGQE